jgi:hypothetical protein
MNCTKPPVSAARARLRFSGLSSSRQPADSRDSGGSHRLCRAIFGIETSSFPLRSLGATMQLPEPRVVVSGRDYLADDETISL